MKNHVLKLLKAPPASPVELFNMALDLFRRSPGAPHRQLSYFNQHGFSKARLESLLYEIKKLHAITEKDILLYQEPVESDVDAKQESPGEPEEFSLGKVITVIMLPELLEQMPEEVKAEVKLRDQFPFLNDLDCPNELKILVSDKMTHYHKWVEAHQKLLTTVPAEGQESVPMTSEEIFELAKKAVENFTANQDIYTELEHFQNTGKILGQHPIFRKRKIAESIENATPIALAKRLSNLTNYINRESRVLERIVEEADKAKLVAKIEGYKEERDMVKAKLDANDNKK